MRISPISRGVVFGSQPLNIEEQKEYESILKQGKEIIGLTGHDIFIMPSQSLPQAPDKNTGIGHLTSKIEQEYVKYMHTMLGFNVLEDLPSGQIEPYPNEFYCNYRSTSLALGDHQINPFLLTTPEYSNLLTEEEAAEIVKSNTRNDKDRFANFQNIMSENGGTDKALKKAYERFEQLEDSTPLKQAYQKFKEQNSEWIDFLYKDKGDFFKFKQFLENRENIISDLIRIYGYDNIANTAKHTPSDSAPYNDYFMRFKHELASRGLNEAKSFGFGNSEIEQMVSDKTIVRISNPITKDMDTARNNLLGNMLIFVRNNEKRGYPDLNLFELGTVFDGDTPNAQHTQICIVRTGDIAPRHWTHRNRATDIYDVKADLIALLHGQNFTIASDNPPRWAHPFRYGAVMQGKKKIAEFGQLHPSVAHALKIKTNVNIAIVDDVENLPGIRKVHEPKLSEFQPITRDFAFVVDSATPAEKLTSVARCADSRITDVVVFDAFDLADGKKSIAFTVTITPTDKMSDTDLQKLQTDVIENVEKKCNAKIRDK